MMRKALFAVVLAGFLTACAHAPRVGSQKVVDKSGAKPDWVMETEESFEKKDKLYFRGLTQGEQDLSIGLRVAKSEALKNVLEKIRLRAESSFSSAVKGNSKAEAGLGRHIQDVIAWAVENLEVSGITVAETYWEKVEEVTHSGVKYSYNIYSLVLLAKNDYLKAVENSANRLKREAKSQKDKAAEEAADEIMKKLESGRME